MHLSAALLLGHVTGRIRRAHDVLQRTAGVADLDQADRNTDVEYLVLPDKAIVGNRVADIGRNLARLVDRAADQQRTELVAAETADEIRVAHLRL